MSEDQNNPFKASILYWLTAFAENMIFWHHELLFHGRQILKVRTQL